MAIIRRKIPRTNEEREVQGWRRTQDDDNYAKMSRRPTATEDNIVVFDSVGDSKDSLKSIIDALFVDDVIGTAKQVIVTDNGDGTITLSAPQDIDTDSVVQFAQLVLADGAPQLILENTGDATGTRNVETRYVFSDGNGACIKAVRPSVGAYTDVYINFFTGGDLATAKARLDDDGNLGLGIVPTEKLHVNGDIIDEGLTASKPVWTNGSKKLISQDIAACDIERTFLTPSTQTVNTGTLTSGTVSDVQAWQDGNEVHITEVSGVPGFDVEYRIDNVSDFCEVMVGFYYVGSSTHDCKVQIYDDANTTWRELLSQSGAALSHNLRFVAFPVASTNYINVSNQVKIRFYHPQSGNASHDLYIDYVSIVGIST